MSRKIVRPSRAQVIALAAQDEQRHFWQQNRFLVYGLSIFLVSWLTMVLYSQWPF